MTVSHANSMSARETSLITIFRSPFAISIQQAVLQLFMAAETEKEKKKRIYKIPLLKQKFSILKKTKNQKLMKKIDKINVK